MPRSRWDPRQLLFRSQVKEKRLAAGMTQAQVAARLDRPQSFVAKYESGERRLDVVEYIEIAQAIGFNPVPLLKQIVEMGQSDSATPELTAKANRALAFGARVVRKRAARLGPLIRRKGAVPPLIVKQAPSGTPLMPHAHRSDGAEGQAPDTLRDREPEPPSRED